MLNPTSAIPVIALSANGSAILPKLVTRLYRRAHHPSTVSVRIPMMNTTVVQIRHVGSSGGWDSSIQPYSGTNRMRIPVSTFGTFQFDGFG